jgi:hypothetical protein
MVALVSTSAGAVTGGAAGGAAAYNEVLNNYLNGQRISTVLELRKTYRASIAKRNLMRVVIKPLRSMA